MKIGITGHSEGFGAALYNKLKYYRRTDCNEVVGFDLTNGYDISQISSIGKILWQIKDFDMFINNAYHPIGQTVLLEKIINLWKNKNKVIINIGSFLIYENLDLSTLPAHRVEYITVKQKQKELIDHYLNNEYNLKIIQINPGFMKTGFLAKNEFEPTPDIKLLTVADIADATINIVDLLDKNIYTKEVTFKNKL
jgi:hypothetical protein